MAKKAIATINNRAINEFREKYNTNLAHTFIFHGAVFDYVEGFSNLKDCLVELFSKNANKQKILIFFDKADGITFRKPEHRQTFLQVMSKELAEMGFADGTLPTDAATSFNLIGRALGVTHNVGEKEYDFGLVVDYAETVFPDGDVSSMSDADRVLLVSILKWAKDILAIKNQKNPIILITNSLSRLNRMLREPSSRIECIGFPYPDPEERADFVTVALDKFKDQNELIEFEGNFDSEAFSRLTAGLARVHINDILRRGAITKKPITAAMVKQRKDDIIKAEFGNVLQISEPRFGLNKIGGYKYIKDYFVKNIIKAVKNGDHLRCPMGVLLMGPAGTGKTILAEGLAFDCGINFANFNVGMLKNKFVGVTEEQTEKALWAIYSTRPIIVFIDELDTLSRGDGVSDGNTTSNIMKRLLEFMSDTTHRGEIIFLGATNRPDKIDFALRRAGRMDKKIPVLPPTAEERPDIYMCLFERFGIETDIKREDITELEKADSGHWKTGSRYEDFVGADIEQVVLKSNDLAMDADRKMVKVEDLKTALSVIKPSTQNIAEMVTIALAECNDLTLMPEEHRKSYAKTTSSTASSDAFSLDSSI